MALTNVGEATPSGAAAVAGVDAPLLAGAAASAPSWMRAQRPEPVPAGHAVTAWLLLLPALVLLVAFTHWPALATLWHSVFSTPKKGRPEVYVGLDN